MFTGFYAIADVDTLHRIGREPEEAVEGLLDAGVEVLQLRWKSGGGGELLEAARTFRDEVDSGVYPAPEHEYSDD